MLQPAKLVRIVDGKPVEQQMSETEQMLADKLAHTIIEAQRAFKRSNLRFWVSVACNGVLLAVIWFAL